MTSFDIGIIGGSGFYQLAELEKRSEVSLTTPFGPPSDVFVTGEIHGKRVAFLARHNRKHNIQPSELNFRANIHGFKQLGVSYLISASAVGSLQEAYAPTHFVFPDQFIDRTKHRVDTFFGEGIVAHVSLADPICHYLQGVLCEAAKVNGITSHLGGTYICMEGPQFSTRAESHLFRSWQADVIGMTNFQEARLAREAEIAYATIAMVTDYDCWREDEEAVTVEMVIKILQQNASRAAATIIAAIKALDLTRENPIHHALKNAILTRSEHIPAQRLKALDVLVGKYLNGA